MTGTRIFDSQVALPDDRFDRKEKTLLGFDERYRRIRNQLRLLLQIDELKQVRSE